MGKRWKLDLPPCSETVPEYPWGREGQDDDELNLGKMEHLTVAVS